jgi:diadenosine tetraphosphate (Ap4A) HIT family hydrolase
MTIAFLFSERSMQTAPLQRSRLCLRHLRRAARKANCSCELDCTALHGWAKPSEVVIGMVSLMDGLYRWTIVRILMKTSFQRIIDGELRASLILRDAMVCAFLDIHPYNAGHTLVAPCHPAASLAELPMEFAYAMFAAGRRIALALRKCGLPCDGVNLKLNDGSAAGQDVMHCHLHVIPRVQGDRLTTAAWGKIPGEAWDEARRAELDAIAHKIRAHLPD